MNAVLPSRISLLGRLAFRASRLHPPDRFHRRFGTQPLSAMDFRRLRVGLGFATP